MCPCAEAFPKIEDRVTDAPHYRLDDLRRFASALGSAVGLNPVRAATLATHLLWFDAAGASPFGIETLADWLERIEARQVDPAAEGRVTRESIGTAILDGQNGPPPLILERAGGVAVEKSRDAGVGLVRVENIGPVGPSACVVAEMAIGPTAAMALGPGPSWALALPSGEGLPAVFDPALEAGQDRGKGGAARPPVSAWLDSVAAWASAIVPEGGWLVGAIAVARFEPLASFHERVGAAMRGAEGSPGRLVPVPWEARRRDAREHGVVVGAAASKRLKRWAERCDVTFPSPLHR